MQDRQINIFDFEKYEVKHSSFKNSLLELNKIIDWSSFLPILNKAFNKEKKSTRGRKSYDRILRSSFCKRNTICQMTRPSINSMTAEASGNF